MLRKEPLNGGVVQVRHATLLRSGELQQADDCILRPGDPALHKAPGRTVYGTVASTTISTNTAGTVTLTAPGGDFGSAISTVSMTENETTLTKAGAFSSAVVGQTVAATGLPSGTYIRRVIDDNNIEVSQSATVTNASATIYISDLRVGTYISGDGIPADTTIAAIVSNSTITMSAAATDSTTANRTFTERVDGLRALTFDSGLTDALLAKAKDSLYYSLLTDTTGTFTSLESGLTQRSDAILDSIQFKNRHIALTGYDPPRIISSNVDDSGDGSQTLSSRALGMLPVSSFSSVTTTSGTWSALEAFQEGYYFFIITEVLNPDEDDEVESTYTGDPKYVYISDYTTQAALVTYQSGGNKPVNDGNYGRNTATHWRVYMSPRNTAQTPEPDLSAYTRVATVPIAEASVTIGTSNPYQTCYASALTAYASDAPLVSDSTNILSQTTDQTLTCVTVAGSNALTSAALFGTVLPGMVITAADDRIPYGTVVSEVTDTSNIIMSNPATAGASGSVSFGNSNTFDNTGATISRNPGSTRRGGLFNTFGFQNVGSFASSVLTGIEVEIKGTFRSDIGYDPGFLVYLNKGGTGGTYSEFRSARFDVSGTLAGNTWGGGIITRGGQFDTWGMSYDPADLIDGAPNEFGVLLRNAFGTSDEVNDHTIDGIKVTFYFGGTDVNNDGENFRAVTISDQLNTSFSVGSNGPPPVASTGDIFEGRLLLNDTADESVVVSSLPDEEEYFPSFYRMPIESRDNDKVRVIRKLSNHVIVGCLNSIKRLNYFPSESDADFSKGRAYEDVASDHGMVGPRSARLVDLPGRGTVLAYLSHNGMHWTDGVTTTRLNEDLDWENLINADYIDRSVLEVYPRLSLLALYYVPAGATRKTKCMYFSYHPTHMKEGLRLPAVGPVSVDGASAASTLLSGVPYLFTGHGTDGKVYVEDSGTDDDSGGTIAPAIRTRRFYMADLGFTGRMERVFLVADQDTGTADEDANFTLTPYRQNSGETLTALTAVTGNTLIGGIIKLLPSNQGETLELGITKAAGDDASLRIHYLGYEATAYGQDVN